jgi:3-oxoacyl-[acyl-carrier protein] reductase
VTGASRGIGCGIAEFLGRQGMRLVLTARSEEDGQAFTRELSAAGVGCHWVTADVSTKEGARAVFEAALERLDGVDLLVNNAARRASKAFLELDEEEYHLSFEANVRMVYELSQLVAHHMADRGGGSIINISSVGGLRAHRGLAGYDASKGAMDALTRSMAVDLAPHGIRVNAIAPGAIALKTDHPGWQEKYARASAGIPLGRMGRAEEIGAAVAFLASEAGAYVTGQVLYVDGGLTTQLTPPGIRI